VTEDWDRASKEYMMMSITKTTVSRAGTDSIGFMA
jgi:hypothetical protein